MRTCQLIFLPLLAGALCCGPSLAAKRPAKPAPPAASKPQASGETICQLQSPCRPVRTGCHLERIGQYNEEVCK
jgi:hypothetical protein